MAQQIGRELKADTTAASLMSNIKIEVSDGKVMLWGKVNSEDEKKSIESTLQKINGVTSVENQLQVGGKSESQTETK